MYDKQSNDTARPSNLSMLQRNILHGLNDERAERMFLRLADHMPILDAERSASKWRDLWPARKWMIERAANAYADQGKRAPSRDEQEDLLNWLEKRFYHRLVPGS